MDRKIVDVAAAVLLRPDGSFLLGERPEGTVCAGYWEFPGGKVERGETPLHALVRELREELGITVEQAYPWILREFVYPHAHVRLHFFRVTAWHGEIDNLHHSSLAWQRVEHISVAPLLPANAPVLRALALPEFYAITHAAGMGCAQQLQRLEHALHHGLRLVQLREPTLAGPERDEFYRDALRLALSHGARVLVSGDIELARRLGADGVHLPSARLMRLTERPALPLVAASCHDAQELAQAAALELDFVVLGPVKASASHGHAPGMDWERFAELARDYPLPVFALGGLRRADLQDAWRAGAHGVAAIRAAWGLT